MLDNINNEIFFLNLGYECELIKNLPEIKRLILPSSLIKRTSLNLRPASNKAALHLEKQG